MGKRPKIRVGKYYNRTLIHPEYLIIATILAFLGTLLAYLFSENMVEERMIVLSVSILLYLATIIVAYYAFIIRIETIFLEGGRCGILDAKVNCRGGCNRCIIAHQYISSINQGDPFDDEKK